MNEKKPKILDSNLNLEILKDFQTESTDLVGQMMAILEDCEGDFQQVQSLEQVGQIVDRIMGGAKSVGLDIVDQNHFIHKIGDYSALCKAVSYKASQIKNNPSFYDTAVAFLLDATEILAQMIEKVEVGRADNFKEIFSQTFLHRLQWISDQFGKDVRSTVQDSKENKSKMSQNEIDELMKKLGL
jgi:chemotaxis protein histidine kinase CheA